ncbi:exodeoxyribonuclease VII large subunit [Candidatus Puniceispirillum sp.]|uniref:exodeoxyribonuclease VII large subunit n=1 Tax=Candidatus Puniceispirillum sp. TaxID=2026719 RepID=UPI002FCDFBF9
MTETDDTYNSQNSATSAGDNAPYMTIGELSKRVKATVEGAFDYVRVRAEISRPTRAPSGHVYFTLKDDRSTLAAVCWKTVAGNLQVQPEEGLEVICSGKLTTYPGQSKYQIVVNQMEMAGEGAMLKMLEERRRMLAAEGLFDPGRKRPIPEMPTTIGVITSPTGAVIRDILHRLDARFGVHVLVWGTLVQGKSAAGQVAAAIRGFDAMPSDGAIPRPDMLIVARGGGALEDLWAFNEEEVVRAVADCSLPVISAIGHETDTTLIDFAADLRAPTPTAAAELAVPVRADLAAHISETEARLKRSISQRLETTDQMLRIAARGLLDPAEMIARRGQMLDYALAGLNTSLERVLAKRRLDLSGLAGRLRPPETRLAEMSGHFIRLSDRLANVFGQMLERHEQAVNSAGKLLQANSFERVLDRGFALVTNAEGTPLKRAIDAPQGAEVTLRFADASRQALLDPDGTAHKAPKPAKKATTKLSVTKDTKQDSLF